MSLTSKSMFASLSYVNKGSLATRYSGTDLVNFKSILTIKVISLFFVIQKNNVIHTLLEEIVHG